MRATVACDTLVRLVGWGSASTRRDSNAAGYTLLGPGQAETEAGQRGCIQAGEVGGHHGGHTLLLSSHKCFTLDK